MSQILVTGGTGLIGGHLIERLLEEGRSALSIRALVRQNSDATFLKEKGVPLCYGDLLDAQSLKAAMRDVEMVFHCAAVLEEKRKELFWKINCQGTEHLLEAARCAHVEKFIHVSTIGVYLALGEPAFSGQETEHKVRKYDHKSGSKTALRRPTPTYVSSKLAAENKVWEYYQSYGLKVVVIRPSLTIGKRDRAITRLLMDWARRRVVPLVAGGRVLVPFIDARDAARALILASKSEQAVGNSYDAQGFSVTLKEVFEFFVESLGTNAKALNVPYSLAYLAALVGETFLSIAKRDLYPLLSGSLVRVARLMVTGLTFDTTKISRELAFEPQYGMHESFRQAIRWQLEQGY